MSPETADTERLPPATEVGDYLIEDLLGVGGFSRVYRARHRILGARVAIKILSRALALDAEAVRRFVHEARSASRISHPNVVRVLGFGKLPDGRAYQVMELVEGPTLESYIEQVRPTIDERLELLAAIAAAIDAAHAANIVHRDLKPSNVLMATVDGRRTPRLTDFGIAKAIEQEENPRLTRTGMTLGTPTYMSPEQALGRPVGPASDIYSFGVVAFELLTGVVPFAGESPFATMMKHVQTPPPAPSSVNAALGLRFDAAVQAMMAKEPSDRPLKIADAMLALRAAPPGSAITPPARKRRRALVIMIAALSTAVAAVIFARLRPADDSPAPPPAPRPTQPARPAPTPSPDIPAAVSSPPAGTPSVPTSPRSTSKRRAKQPAPDAGMPSNQADTDSIEIPPDYEP